MKMHGSSAVFLFIVSCICFSCNDDESISPEFVGGELVSYRNASDVPTGAVEIRLFRKAEIQNGEEVFSGLTIRLFSPHGSEFQPGNYVWWKAPSENQFSILSIVPTINRMQGPDRITYGEPELQISYANIEIRIAPHSAMESYVYNIDPEYIIDCHYLVDGKDYREHFVGKLFQIVQL